jgi:hypothetical protein
MIRNRKHSKELIQNADENTSPSDSDEINKFKSSTNNINNNENSVKEWFFFLFWPLMNQQCEKDLKKENRFKLSFEIIIVILIFV